MNAVVMCYTLIAVLASLTILTMAENEKIQMISILFAALIPFTKVQSTTTDGFAKCVFQVTDLQLARTDSKWFEKSAKSGFHVLEHGACNNCGTQEAFAWVRPQGRAINKIACYLMSVTTKYGSYEVPMTCKYNVIEDQLCKLDFGKTNIADKLAFEGTIKIVNTDNSTYIAGTTCLLEKENFYWILTTEQKKELDPEVYKRLMDHFYKVGFKENNVAVKGESPFFFEKLITQGC